MTSLSGMIIIRHGRGPGRFSVPVQTWSPVQAHWAMTLMALSSILQQHQEGFSASRKLHVFLIVVIVVSPAQPPFIPLYPIHHPHSLYRFWVAYMLFVWDKQASYHHLPGCLYHHLHFEIWTRKETYFSFPANLWVTEICCLFFGGLGQLRSNYTLFGLS